MKLLPPLFAVTVFAYASILVSAEFKIATFSADVTVPIGHGMMGGLWKSKSVADPLFAKGVVLIGGEKPVVFVSVDWCEIRNASFDRWREELALAAGTSREHVLVSAIHQHEAPVTDLDAQQILNRRNLAGSICDLAFHEKAVRRVASSLRIAMDKKQRITHLGLGRAKVEKIASNRRYVLPDGKISFGRGSSSGRNVLAAKAPEGTIDPWLKTISFWNEDRPIVALPFFLLATRNGLPNGNRAFHRHPHAGSGPPLHLCWDRSHGEAAPVHTVAHLHMLPLLRSLCEPALLLSPLHPA